MSGPCWLVSGLTCQYPHFGPDLDGDDIADATILASTEGDILLLPGFEVPWDDAFYF